MSSSQGNIWESDVWQNFPDAEVVVHLAARTFVPESWANSDGYLQTNFMGTVQALEFCRSRNAHLVFLSSYMYGEPKFLPIPETADLAARNPYAFSKMISEKACQFYMDSFGMKVTVLRPFNAYGSGQSTAFLVPSIVSQIMAGGPIRVLDLAPKRDYIYVKDLVAAISAVIDTHASGGVFNIGSGVSHSVAELIAEVQAVLGTSLPVESAEERRPGEILDTVADISAARMALGWTPRFSLREGLADMLRVP
ncbi:hypothetical protein GETHOR_25650 [Geothrix oryzae]|uniref:NAD(P)-binding domain-containing protein n=2 Tax=Geothrix oryzae TaxID=2927975 RepID=A0ABM8DTQ9_9BACT|nr:hypothetical protein GETHOR_25650 [Geothrix oryzae]